MQEPLDNLSESARRVHTHLDEDPDRTEQVEAIAEAVGLSTGQTANALRENWRRGGEPPRHTEDGRSSDRPSTRFLPPVRGATFGNQ